MQIKAIIDHLEAIAPLDTQESYDNSGLIVGDVNAELSCALIALDCTEAVVEEAIDKKCNLIITHHPIVFKGLKRITGSNYVERVVIKAIQHAIVIYSIHTNLDHYFYGVNQKIAQKIGVRLPKILSPVDGRLVKLSVFVPTDHLQTVRNAIFSSGAGNVGHYADCSFSTTGEGTFRGDEHTQPAYGEKMKRTHLKENKLEVIVPAHNVDQTVASLLDAHPYEEVAYDLVPLKNKHPWEGAGMIGDLSEPVGERDFLDHLKRQFGCPAIRHSALLHRPIQRVAWCGGAGQFLIPVAKKQRADIYITADVTYHHFFEAEGQLLIADIGHYESEQFTTELIAELIIKKIPKFAFHLTDLNVNPVNYI